MPFMHDDLLDNGLADIAGDTVRVDICYTQEPTTYTEATSTYSCGNKTGLTVSAVGNASSGTGRSVTTPAITDGTVSADQTAAYWAITDGVSKLWAAGSLSATQAVVNGNTFTLDAIELFHRDATAV